MSFFNRKPKVTAPREEEPDIGILDDEWGGELRPHANPYNREYDLTLLDWDTKGVRSPRKPAHRVEDEGDDWTGEPQHPDSMRPRSAITHLNHGRTTT
jgi:hypothetical protein